MSLIKRGLPLIIFVGLLVLAFPGHGWSATDTPVGVSTSSVNEHLENASDALKKEDQTKAINELLKAIKEQQEIIQNLQKNPTPLPATYGSTQSTPENNTLMEQLRNALPIIGGKYGDVEEQWRKAWKLQHHAIFDLTRKEAAPVFADAIKEYRVIVERFPLSNRAPQAQRQISWIYNTQLKNKEQAKIEWTKLTQLFPNSQYVGEARKALAELGSND